ncbi:MAG: GGDEF domain-containing protein [Methylobacterium sp.]|uniref:diguanylate cyclase n=1 Tax=Methylobacterium sp. TaxID=409 RepID=UPI0025D82CB3|nr:diguanylate cyclase [Methylobacterium sp.]MBX9931438.1 GGDEF domain-containing protein [Methylobacterium sp.]
MPRVETQAISVEEIEREIASGSRRLVFSPSIEAVFENYSARPRLHMMMTAGVVAMILYDLFLIVDFVTLNDMFHVMIFLRIGIFTPIVLSMVVTSYYFKPSAFILESLTLAAGFVAVALPTIAMMFSESSYRLNYQYGSLLVMMFSTIVSRLRFRFAVAGLVSMLSIQLATTYISGAFDAETYLGIVMFFATACVLITLTTYYLEHGERRSFLFALRGQLLREQIEASARTDPLTGLFNRRHLAETGDGIWQDAVDLPRAVSVILLDIDHFKAFNDSQGHIAGDSCLRTVSRCISEIAEERHGLTFRFGGEEMLVLLPGAGVAEAMVTAEFMRRGIENAAIPHPGVGGFVTASIGVASGIAPETDIASLIAAADHALYAAKHAGRNRVMAEAVRAAAEEADVLAAA